MFFIFDDSRKVFVHVANEPVYSPKYLSSRLIDGESIYIRYRNEEYNRMTNESSNNKSKSNGNE